MKARKKGTRVLTSELIDNSDSHQKSLISEVSNSYEKILKSKRSVSIIIGYVLLVVIAISLSLLVYAWLKNYIPGEPEKCPDSVSLTLADYSCNLDEKNITLTLKNTGLFNLYGFITRVKNDTSEFFYELKSGGEIENYFASSAEGLKPNDDETWILSYANYGSIVEIQIQPFVLGDKEITICGNAIISQKIENCVKILET